MKNKYIALDPDEQIKKVESLYNLKTFKKFISEHNPEETIIILDTSATSYNPFDNIIRFLGNKGNLYLTRDVLKEFIDWKPRQEDIPEKRKFERIYNIIAKTNGVISFNPKDSETLEFENGLLKKLLPILSKSASYQYMSSRFDNAYPTMRIALEEIVKLKGFPHFRRGFVSILSHILFTDSKDLPETIQLMSEGLKQESEISELTRYSRSRLLKGFFEFSQDSKDSINKYRKNILAFLQKLEQENQNLQIDWHYLEKEPTFKENWTNDYKGNFKRMVEYALNLTGLYDGDQAKKLFSEHFKDDFENDKNTLLLSYAYPLSMYDYPISLFISEHFPKEYKDILITTSKNKYIGLASQDCDLHQLGNLRKLIRKKR